MARMIDADRLADGLKLHRQPTDQKHEADRQWAVGYNAGLDRALHSIAYAPTITQPNELLTLQELKAEAKRQGYKLIKDKNPRFERCLCGHNVHQWVSGPEGWAVYCKHCGLQGPWANKSHNAVIVAWNEMIRARRMGEYRNGL